MIRKVAFTLGGIGLFVSGGVLGPPMWNFVTGTSEPVVVEKEQEAKDKLEAPSKDGVKIAPLSPSSPTTETEPKTSAEVSPSVDSEVIPNLEKDKEQLEAGLDKDIASEENSGDIHTPSTEEDLELPEVKEQIIEAKIEAGDSLSVLFEDYTDVNSAILLAKTIDKEFSVKSLRVGHPYLIEFDAEKDVILRFEYEINSREKLIAVVDGEIYKAHIEKIHYDKKLAYVEGTINDSLFLTIEKLNESPQLALQVANMFRWDINFIRDVRAGDSFSILVEKLYREGEFKGYGRAIGATFTNSGKKYESFLYYDSNKKEMHYNAKGENKRKVLLQSPLSFTRVTSGYTHSRKHPIYGTYRPHLGVDYGAPMGTPIMAVGDGVITYYGWRGGYGKHITVRHTSGLESMYSHMSRYGRGLKKGSKVSQGQTIGYVGSTGVSTGPHLDFRLKQNGKYINPTKAINPRAAAVSKVHQDGYEARKKMVREFMDGTRTLESYDPTSIDVSQK